jgi:hypothetical protein
LSLSTLNSIVSAQRLHRTAYQNPRLLRHFVPRNDPFLVIASEAKQSEGRTETPDSFRPNAFIVWPITTQDCFGTSCLAMTKRGKPRNDPFLVIASEAKQSEGRTETPDSFRPNGFIVRPIGTQDCFGTSCLAMTPFSSLRAKRSNLRGRTETADSFRPNGSIVRPIKTQDCFGTSCLAMTPSSSLRAKRSNLRGGPRRWTPFGPTASSYGLSKPKIASALRASQ